MEAKFRTLLPPPEANRRMILPRRTLFLLVLLAAATVWATLSMQRTTPPPPPAIPTLDQRARAIPSDAACVAPAREAESGPSPRCAFAFQRAVGALGVPPEGTPMVVSLVHASTGTWSLPAAEPLKTFAPLPAEREAQVILVSAARDTALFAVASELIAYRLSTGEVAGRAPAPGAMVDDLAWTEDGTRLVAASGGKASVLDASGTVLRSLPVDGAAQRVAVTPDGSRIAVANEVGGITLFVGDAEAAPRTVTPSLQPAARLAFVGDLLWVAGSDGVLRALDATSGEERTRVEVGSPLTRLAITPDGAHAATAARDRKLRLHALPSGAVVAELDWHQAQITALAFGAGPTLVSGDSDGALAVWDAATLR